MPETTEQPKEQYLSDFTKDGASNRDVLSRKSAYLAKYGLEDFQALVSRSIRKQKADRKS